MKKNINNNQKGFIEMIEEAVHALRLSPVRAFFYYYIGSFPFVLGIFFFIGDMSGNAYADEYCVAASFGLAVLFIWMKCWQAVFAMEIKSGLGNMPRPAWSFKMVRQLILLQTVLQSTGFIMLPIAALITLPFGYAFAFYQNLMVQDYNEDFSIKTAVRRAMNQAILWPKQNHFLIGIFFLFSIIIMANTGSAIFLLPYVLKQYLGIETIFTLSGSSVFNTTFITVLLGMTYLFMDPIVKTVYVLRCFYGLSLETGDDLKSELKTILSEKAVVTLILFTAVTASLAWRPSVAVAAESIDPPRAVSKVKLDTSIDGVIVKPEFTWRIPREAKAADNREIYNPFTRTLKWIKSAIGKITRPIRDFLKKLFRKYFKPSSSEPGRRKTISRIEWMTAVQVLLFVLLCLTVCTLVIYLRRVWLQRKTGHIAAVPLEFDKMPDLTDDAVTADELPRDRWMALAGEMIAEGNLQLALRALYLASLAHLADLNLITIAHYKSNRDYEGELKRRAHEKKDLIHLFSNNVSVFDRTWYGLYKVTMDDVRLFSTNCERMAAFAE